MALEPELAIIVDEHDTVLEIKPRLEINLQDRMRTVVVWLENSKGEVLIHKRSMKKSAWPGKWENAAGGGVNHTQTYEQAAYAELEEEIGVTGITLEFLGTRIVVTDRGERMCGWFKGTLDWPLDKFVLEADTVDEVKWINKAELLADRDANPEKYMPSSAYWRELFS